MDLTSELLAPFIGGQIEIQNDIEGYIFRGEIEEIWISGEGDGAELNVRLKWMAKGKGFPPAGWVNDTNLTYNLGLMMSSTTENDGRIIIHSVVSSELIAIFPPGGSTLDPSRVEGLELAS